MTAPEDTQRRTSCNRPTPIPTRARLRSRFARSSRPEFTSATTPAAGTRRCGGTSSAPATASTSSTSSRPSRCSAAPSRPPSTSARGQLHVTQRWLGGTLTNFKTVKGSLDRLRGLEKLEEDGTLFALAKKEQIRIRRERDKLLKSLGGIKEMNRLPGAMFVIDPNKEHIAVAEARKLEIPVIAVTDTNCNPDRVDYVIPGNDDAIRAIKLFANRIADAALIGSKLHKERGSRGGNAEDLREQQVIVVSSGGDGPRVEIAQSGSQLTPAPEASATPEEQ
jgi:hypothetical protein